MKQIVDKLNDIAKAIDPNVTLPTTNLITDSLDAITKAYGGTPTNSDLIVDKLGDIAENVTGGGGSTPSGTKYIVNNGITDVTNYRVADVNVKPVISSEGTTIINNTSSEIFVSSAFRNDTYNEIVWQPERIEANQTKVVYSAKNRNSGTMYDPTYQIMGGGGSSSGNYNITITPSTAGYVVSHLGVYIVCCTHTATITVENAVIDS